VDGVWLKGQIMQVQQVEYMWQICVDGERITGIESKFAAAMNQVERHLHQNAPVEMWKSQTAGQNPLIA
jgi:hypothetical protein